MVAVAGIVVVDTAVVAAVASVVVDIAVVVAFVVAAFVVVDIVVVVVVVDIAVVAAVVDIVAAENAVVLDSVRDPYHSFEDQVEVACAFAYAAVASAYGVDTVLGLGQAVALHSPYQDASVRVHCYTQYHLMLP